MGDEDGGGLAWDTHCAAGLALGASVGMADLIRQTEEACVERAAATAAAWNLHVAVSDGLIGDGDVHICCPNSLFVWLTFLAVQ